MTKRQSFALRLLEHERERAKRLSEELGYSENRLYAELIHDGLLIQEQMAYMRKMRALGREVSTEEARALLDRASDIESEEHDRLPDALRAG